MLSPPRSTISHHHRHSHDTQLPNHPTSPPPSPPTPGPRPIPLRYHLRHLHSLSIHDLRHLRAQQARLVDPTIPDYDREVAFTIAHDQAQESLSDLRRCLKAAEKRSVGWREIGRDGVMWGTLPLLWLLSFTSRRPGWISFLGGVVATTAAVTVGMVELGPWTKRTLMQVVGEVEGAVKSGREVGDVEERALEHWLWKLVMWT